jgi:hypothetical protein
MTLDPTLLQHLDDNGGEALAEGGTWLLDLVAAVDHLRRGARPGITVWDAIGEAIRWTVDESTHAAPDPAAVAIHPALTYTAVYGEAEMLQMAIRRWVVGMSDRYNDSHHWPHPAARRSFPPPLINRIDS